MNEPAFLLCKKAIYWNEIDKSYEIKSLYLEIEKFHITKVLVLDQRTYEQYKNEKTGDKTGEIIENFLVSPAFVNGHTHIAMNIFRGFNLDSSTKGNMIEDFFFKIESSLQYEDILAFARIGAWESLFNGVGCLWDHYYCGLAIAQAIEEVGLCAVVAPTLQDLHGPSSKKVEQTLADTQEINEKSHTNGIYAALGPHAPDTVSKKLWGRITELGVKWNVPLHFHLAQTYDEYAKIQSNYNLSPTSYLNQLGVFSHDLKMNMAHGIFINQNEFDLFTKNQTLVFCPFSALIFAFPAHVESWQNNEINWIVATDATASNDSFNLQKELRYVSGVPLQSPTFSQDYLNDKFDKAMELRKDKWEHGKIFRNINWLLDKVWRLPGEGHTQFKCGILAENHLANLAIWDLDDVSLWPFSQLRTLAFGDTQSALAQMMVKGRWIGQRGEFINSLKNSTLYKDHISEANRRFKKMCEKLKLY